MSENPTNGPAELGVPEIAPPEESVRTSGSAPPVNIHVYGGVAPLAVSVVE